MLLWDALKALGSLFMNEMKKKQEIIDRYKQKHAGDTDEELKRFLNVSGRSPEEKMACRQLLIDRGYKFELNFREDN